MGVQWGKALLANWTHLLWRLLQATPQAVRVEEMTAGSYSSSLHRLQAYSTHIIVTQNFLLIGAPVIHQFNQFVHQRPPMIIINFLVLHSDIREAGQHGDSDVTQQTTEDCQHEGQRYQNAF